jgi:amino acid transporter
MTPREAAEYAALRATIRERGTVRVCLFFAALVAWAAATIAMALAALPVATLLPLLLLAAGFEAIFNLHTGVERVGRYLQVFYDDLDESQPGREWERTAMEYGRAFPGAGSDALFALYFFLATAVNFVPVLLSEPRPLELYVVGAVHIVFAGRVLIARHKASTQRATDLERFKKIKDAAGSQSATSARVQP